MRYKIEKGLYPTHKLDEKNEQVENAENQIQESGEENEHDEPTIKNVPQKKTVPKILVGIRNLEKELKVNHHSGSILKGALFTSDISLSGTNKKITKGVIEKSQDITDIKNIECKKTASGLGLNH